MSRSTCHARKRAAYVPIYPTTVPIPSWYLGGTRTTEQLPTQHAYLQGWTRFNIYDSVLLSRGHP